jgi:hypothetical protein
MLTEHGRDMRHFLSGVVVGCATLFLCGGCASQPNAPDYEQRLKSVRAGDVEMKPDEELAYEDEFVRFEWSFPDDKIGRFMFKLENKTDSEITLQWNKASYVDPSGTSQSVYHSGVSPLEKGDYYKATRIPSKSNIEDVIVPANHVRVIQTKHANSPSVLPIIKAHEDAFALEYAPLVAREAEGKKTVRLILPLKYKDREARYSFYFEIWVANETN